jgi:hypothetical protein
MYRDVKETLPEKRSPSILDASLVAATTMKLLRYCEGNDWSGYDPYDGLNSKVFVALPFLDSRWPRIAITQAFKRSPINLRRLLMVPKTQNPKALGLFLSALLKLTKNGYGEHEQNIGRIIDLIVQLRSKGESYWCWGYSFPWQTRTLIVPAGAPNLVCTSFVADALVDAYEQLGDQRCLEMAVSAAEYIVDVLFWTEGPTAGFSYPVPQLRAQIHNANFLAAALLSRIYVHTRDRKFLEPALLGARCSAAAQSEDGSWAYGLGGVQAWVDNFHTGFNLCALRTIGRSLRTDEFDSCTLRGLKFYKEHFFTGEGIPKYFHNSTYPIDVHSVAQSIITLVAFEDVDPHNREVAGSVFRWAMKHLWDGRGYFYYRVLRLLKIRTSYMRWSQAWMLLALTTLIEPNPIDAANFSSSQITKASTGVS